MTELCWFSLGWTACAFGSLALDAVIAAIRDRRERMEQLRKHEHYMAAWQERNPPR